MTQATGPIGLADLDRIVEISKRLPVFPAAQNKRPLVQSGFHAATQDEKQIRAWWRQWPDALVAVPTGQSTGLVIIDFDPDKATQATRTWLVEHSLLLLATRSHKTPRGGFHYVYRSNDRYQTGTDLILGGSPRRGIDLRANGGYVIWWPCHIAQTDDNDVMPLPAGLIDERRFDAKRDMAPLPAASPQQWKAERQKAVSALEFLTPDGYEFWIRIGMAIHSASGGSDDGFSVWHEWSATGDAYDGIEDCRYHWASFGGYQGRPIGLGTLFAAAKAEGFSITPMRQELPPVEVYEDDVPPMMDELEFISEEEPAPEEPPKTRMIHWPSLEGKEPPPRNWRVQDWMTDGPMLFSGKGGAGKSTVSQALATALALGKPYWGEATEPLKVLCWQCEDSHDEMWRRQIPISQYFGEPLSALHERLYMDARLGEENTLLAPVFGTPRFTSTYDQLREQVNDLKIDVLFLDNIGHTFGANENARHDVTMFVNGLAGLVTDRPFSTVLMGHTARSQGSEFAGSAAWENAVRMRWWLGHTLPDQQEAVTTEQQDENIRYLAKRKANYSTRDVVKFEFQGGLFVPERAETTTVSDRYGSMRYAEEARGSVLYAIRKANEQGHRVIAATNTASSLMRWMRDLKYGVGHSNDDLLRALNELIATGKVGMREVGRFKGRQRQEGLVVL